MLCNSSEEHFTGHRCSNCKVHKSFPYLLRPPTHPAGRTFNPELPISNRRNHEAGKVFFETSPICIFPAGTQLDYRLMPFFVSCSFLSPLGSRQGKLQFPVSWKSKWEFGRNPDANCKADKLKPAWVVCARYLRRNPDFLAVCCMISTRCNGRISTHHSIGAVLWDWS